MTAFPTRFDKLENLRYLNLSEAGFTGQIPIEISRLTRLVTLDLSIDTLFRTPLKLEKPNLKTLVQNLTKLRILYLYGVNISAMGNEWCQALSPLTELNNLSGLIPQFFTKFPNLTCLSLSSGNFSGPIPSFSSSINLRDLILALNQLNGTIHSTDWSGLSKLEIIGLGNNKLSGTIPPTLFGIPSLRTLSLSHNQFNGSIGDFHGKASSLINTLDLSNNMLQGQFPMFVFELHGLTSLNLSSNNFSGLIPVSAFQNLRNLSALGLSYNRWSIDATTINISSLSFPTIAELDLASCNLTEFPGFLKNWISLHVLDLSKNQIHGKIPDWIWKPIDLARLNLSQNFLVGFERPLKNITSSVEILDLHGNQLQGEIPILSNAAYLDYSNNNFNSVLPAQIGDSLQYAFFFSLSNNNIQGSIPESICNSKYLEVLDLSNNSLSGPIPQCLFQMNRSLGVLNLRRNNLSGIISDTSSKSCQLQTLNLNQNRLEGKVPNSLVNCKMVKLLDIGNNHINDSFPCHLKNIATLRVVVLRSNKFNGYIDCPGNNSGWKMLQILNLASNNFSELQHLQCEDLRSGVKYQDAITMTIKGLVLELVKIPTVFTYIDISCNNFEGPIPEVIGKFNALYSLNVSHNAFTGPIPSSFGNLRELESLDLSSNSLRDFGDDDFKYYEDAIPVTIKGNKLELVKIPVNNFEGPKPEVIGKFEALDALNFSHNAFTGSIPTTFGNLRELGSYSLVGPIPASTQLQSFSEASFENNSGLCGPPLKTMCGLPPAKEDSPSDSETGSIIH
uniref:Leucine-rich repeat-containing N-terminal plant-type domain-containing protein n=2 Tax=Gossypium TaxID=3633 RepID=A0A0D2QCE4_GOSRA|nr:hypothetical protein B456_002G262400 [Gossypium raimondii]